MRLLSWGSTDRGAWGLLLGGRLSGSAVALVGPEQGLCGGVKQVYQPACKVSPLQGGRVTRAVNLGVEAIWTVAQLRGKSSATGSAPPPHACRMTADSPRGWIRRQCDFRNSGIRARRGKA